MTMNDPNRPKSKRRWYQFSLRTLIVLLVVGALVLGWRVRRATKNRERLVAVEDVLADIKDRNAAMMAYAYEQRRPATWLESLFDDPGGADDPVGVKKVVYVYEGWWNGDLPNKITEAELNRLRKLMKLGGSGIHCKIVTSDEDDVEQLRRAQPNCEIASVPR